MSAATKPFSYSLTVLAALSIVVGFAESRSVGEPGSLSRPSELVRQGLPVSHGSTDVRPPPPDDAPVLSTDERYSNRAEGGVATAPPPLGGAVWTVQGPSPMINGQVENLVPGNEVSGAIHTVLAHPTNQDILYAGAVNGGIWKTTNATAQSPTWIPLTDAYPALAISALAFDPTDATKLTLVAGIGRYSSFGRLGPRRTGLLRTTDGGASWTAIDGGGVLVDKNISGVAVRGGVIVVSVNYALPNDDCALRGLFRSTDGGMSFSRISGSAATGLPSSWSYDLVEDPTDLTVLYTVADCTEVCGGGVNGVYKSTDTGATWAKVSNGAMDALISCGITSNVEMAVGNASQVYAAILNYGQVLNGGIFRSGNGGATWTKMDSPAMPEGSGVAITNASNTSPIVITSPGHGLPFGDVVDVSGVTGNTAANGLFAVEPLTDDLFALNGSTGNGVYTGGGEWTTVTGANPRFRPAIEEPMSAGGQGGTHFSIVADPADAYAVYIGGDRQAAPFPNFLGAWDYSGNVWRGDASVPATGGMLSPQWENLSHSDSIPEIPGGGTASASAPHADSREMTFDAGGDIIEVDDGGIYRRTSPRDNTGDWFSINGNLQVTEMHDVAYDTNSSIIIGGNQDTGTAYQIVPGGMVWNSISTGDGGDVAVDAVTLAGSNRSIRYTSYQVLAGFRRSVWDASNNLVSYDFPSRVVVGGGADPLYGFKTPVELNAVDPTRLVIAAMNSVYESWDQADTIFEAGPGVGTNNYSTDAVVYGGRSEGIPNLDVLYVGFGSSVYIRTGPAPSPLVPSTPYDGGYVHDIVLDPEDWRIAYVVDGDERVWRTTNTGASWDELTGNLVDVGELVSIEFMEGHVVVGADQGVFVSNIAVTPGLWNELGTNLPNAPVYDLDYDPIDNVLVASTLGRGAWSFHSAGVCGDGEIQFGEECDDGNVSDDDGCSSSCILECAPAPDLLGLEPAAVEKNRYVSFVPTTPGLQTALRVTLTSSIQFPETVGSSWWVGEAAEVCENSGQATPPPEGCGFAGGGPLTFIAAPLQCAQHCADWGAVADTVHVYGQHIVPEATYFVESVQCGVDACDPPRHSAPLPIATSRWCDVCGSSGMQSCGVGPDNVIDFPSDLLGVMDKFSNLSTGLPKARSDLRASLAGDPGVDNIIDVTDYLAVIDAFVGGTFTFAGPQPCSP